MQLSLPFASTQPREDPRRTLQREAPRTLADPRRTLQRQPRRILDDPSIVFVRHPRARRYVIRVLSDGTVRVTIPRGGSKREARAFAERQQRWIDEQRRRVAVEDVSSPGGGDEDVECGIRELARHELPKRLLELARDHGLEVGRVSVRNQRWRWGSCSRTGHICLNWRLIRMPAAIRDYVMIHELMHLKRMDHSWKFWKLVERVCPDYKSARQWLRDYARHGSARSPYPEPSHLPAPCSVSSPAL
jgi:predicted metal-dependent hydrolase